MSGTLFGSRWSEVASDCVQRAVDSRICRSKVSLFVTTLKIAPEAETGSR